MKKKQEKKKKKIMTTRNRADSSDDEFMWLIRFHCWHTISSYGMKSNCFIFIPWCIIKKAHRLILITGGSSILLAPVGSTVIRDQTVYTQKCIRPWNQNKNFLQIQRIFTWSNKGGTDTFFTRANICAGSTPDIVISRDERRIK